MASSHRTCSVYKVICFIRDKLFVRVFTLAIEQAAVCVNLVQNYLLPSVSLKSHVMLALMKSQRFSPLIVNGSHVLLSNSSRLTLTLATGQYTHSRELRRKEVQTFSSTPGVADTDITASRICIISYSAIDCGNYIPLGFFSGKNSEVGRL